jgi:hypothetical protein
MHKRRFYPPASVRLPGDDGQRPGCRIALRHVGQHMGHLANRAWWWSHAIITVEPNQSGARLCDLAEHADAWHGEVFAQSYLHGLNRPEAKRQVESLCYNA